MKNLILVLVISLLCLAGCSKPSTPSAASTPAPPAASSPVASPEKNDAVQQKLLEYSGGGATDCGRLDVKAAEAQMKTASDCAMQAVQAKKPFYVAYDMPGMAVGVAGNGEGKLFTVQAQ